MKRMNFPHRKAQRRLEAVARADDRAKRSNRQQLLKLVAGHFAAIKETRRLNQLLAKVKP